MHPRCISGFTLEIGCKTQNMPKFHHFFVVWGENWGEDSNFISLTWLAHTWRIISVGKWLGSPPFIRYKKDHLGGVTQPYLWDLLTKVNNHLLNGIILQVDRSISEYHLQNYGETSSLVAAEKKLDLQK